MSCPCHLIFSNVLRKERLVQVCAILYKQTGSKTVFVYGNRSLCFAKLSKIFSSSYKEG